MLRNPPPPPPPPVLFSVTFVVDGQEETRAVAVVEVRAGGILVDGEEAPRALGAIASGGDELVVRAGEVEAFVTRRQLEIGPVAGMVCTKYCVAVERNGYPAAWVRSDGQIRWATSRAQEDSRFPLSSWDPSRRAEAEALTITARSVSRPPISRRNPGDEDRDEARSSSARGEKPPRYPVRGDRVVFLNPKVKKHHGKHGVIKDTNRGNVLVEFDDGVPFSTRMAMLVLEEDPRPRPLANPDEDRDEARASSSSPLLIVSGASSDYEASIRWMLPDAFVEVSVEAAPDVGRGRGICMVGTYPDGVRRRIAGVFPRDGLWHTEIASFSALRIRSEGTGQGPAVRVCGVTLPAHDKPDMDVFFRIVVDEVGDPVSPDPSVEVIMVWPDGSATSVGSIVAGGREPARFVFAKTYRPSSPPSHQQPFVTVLPGAVANPRRNAVCSCGARDAYRSITNHWNCAQCKGGGPAVRCPGCNQSIISGECGGEGEGICSEAAYCFDSERFYGTTRRAEWEADWPPPDARLCAEILKAHDKAAGVALAKTNPFGVSRRGRSRPLKLPTDPAELRKRLKELGKEKISVTRAAGYEPMADLEDVAQAAMLARAEEAERGNQSDSVNAAMYAAMNDEIARSSAVSEIPARLMHEVAGAFGDDFEDPEVRRARLGLRQYWSATRLKGQYRRERLDEGIKAETVRRIDPFLAEVLAEAFRSLSYRERTVLGLRFGLRGDPTYTLHEVAQVFRISMERARQLEVEALHKLRRRVEIMVGEVAADEVSYESNPRRNPIPDASLEAMKNFVRTSWDVRQESDRIGGELMKAVRPFLATRRACDDFVAALPRDSALAVAVNRLRDAMPPDLPGAAGLPNGLLQLVRNDLHRMVRAHASAVHFDRFALEAVEKHATTKEDWRRVVASVPPQLVDRTAASRVAKQRLVGNPGDEDRDEARASSTPEPPSAPPGFRFGSYKIKMAGGKTRAVKEGVIIGERFGVEDVHLTMGAKLPLTHLPTGMRVASAEHTTHGVRIAEALLALPGVPWESKKVPDLMAHKDRIAAAIKSVRP